MPTTTPSTTTARLRPPRRWRRRIRRALGVVSVVYLGVAIYHAALKPLPEGLSTVGAEHHLPEDAVEFLYDITWRDGDALIVRQSIYDRVLQLIREAQDVVVVDLFLFNDYLGRDSTPYRRLSREVVTALVEKKRERPAIAMVVITDPVNEAYGGSELPLFAELRAAGIPVVFTRLERLRDSNASYSAFWRMFVRWFGTSPGGGMPHPFAPDAGGVGLRSWLALLNFKANHRKLVIADAPDAAGGRVMTTMVMSANPHDGSSAHGNVAVCVRGGELWRDVWRSEQAVLRFSAPDVDLDAMLPPYARQHREAVEASSAGAGTADVRVQLLTEAKIRDELLAHIAATKAGDAIDVAMFYLADRRVVQALVRAARRDVSVRVLLDPNRDAFGYKKNGVPNVPVALELIDRGRGNILVRWYHTHGEQFHSKLVLLRRADGHTAMFAGSANLTRRNVGDFNLESNLLVQGDRSARPLHAAIRYFDAVWANEDHEYTVPYESFADPAWTKRWQYRIQEATGLGTF